MVRSPRPGNAIEQTLFVAHGRIVIDELADRLDDRGNLLIQPLEMLGDPLLDRGARNLKTIALLDSHPLQRLQTQHQGVQVLLGRGRRQPGSGATFGTELGDQSGIGLVGLRAYQTRRAEGLDLSRIDDTYRDLLETRQELGHGFPVRSGCFHADVEQFHALFIQPEAQLLKSRRIVLYHLVAHLPFGQTQRAVELGLGNVDSQLKSVQPIFLSWPPRNPCKLCCGKGLVGTWRDTRWVK